MKVFQDHKGFMWIGTYDGLNRYDGFDFILYKNDPSDPTSLAGDIISAIFEDHDRNLLVGSNRGLSLFDWNSESFLNFMQSGSSPLNGISCSVNSIEEDTAGNLWLATNVALIYYDRMNNEIIPYTHDPENPESLSSNYAEYVYLDSRNRLWVCTRGGLNIFQPEANSFRKVTKCTNSAGDYTSTFFYCMAEDKDGALWIGSEDGLFCIRDVPQTGEIEMIRYRHEPGIERSLSLNGIQTIYVDEENNVWLGTENGGINLLDRDTELFWHYRIDAYDPASLNNESIWDIYEDHSHNLWVGTFSGGINVSIKQYSAIIHFACLRGAPFSLSHNVVASMLEDRDGHIWIGTDGGGLNLFDGKTKKFLHYNTENAELSSNAVLSLIRDTEDRIWMGSWDGGLMEFDPENRKARCYTIHNSTIPDNNIFSVQEGDHNDLWLGSFSSGLIHFDKDGKQFSYFNTQNSRIVNNYVFVVRKDLQGRLYLGTTNGVQRYDPSNNTFRLFIPETGNEHSLSHENIFDILIENDTSVWIGTQNGLNHFDPRSELFTSYYKSDGLPDNVIKGLVLDSMGNLWVTTNKGLGKFSIHRDQREIYTREDGLQSNEFFYKSAMRTRDGRIFVGGTNGFNLIYPDKIQKNTRVPEVLITGLNIFNEPVRVGAVGSPLKQHITETDKIRLRHDQSVLTFFFSVMDFTIPEKNQYAYMMENFDEDWIYAGKTRQATYTNLDPGRYVFRVRGSNNDGIWNREGDSLYITVQPPWWESIWFRIAAIIFIVGLLVGFYYLRMGQLRRQKSRLMEMVEERTAVIEEKNVMLQFQADELSEINTTLEERQQQIEEQAEEMRAQADELSKANKTLLKLNSTKDKFFSIIAHDLKNPFSSILGFCEVLLSRYDKYDDTKRKHLIGVIERSAENIYKLLENLLQWARSQTGNIKYEPEEFKLIEIIQNIVTLVSNSLTEKELKLVNEIPSDLVIKADKNMLNTIVRNLVTNAIKFSEKAEIRIRAEIEKKAVKISVIDQGVGLHENVKDKIFEVEKSKSTEGTRGESGTGLGLIICKEFVQRHGGTIHVESEYGKGSTFYFIIPQTKKT